MSYAVVKYVSQAGIRIELLGDVPEWELVDAETDPLHPTKWESKTGRPKGGHTPEESSE